MPLYRISEWNYQVFTVLLSFSTPRLSVKLWQAIVKSFFIHLLQLRQGRNLLWTSVWEKNVWFRSSFKYYLKFETIICVKVLVHDIADNENNNLK